MTSSSQLGGTATATSEEPGYEAAKAVDGKPGTLWHTEYTKRKPLPPHDLVLRFPRPLTLAAVVLTQRQDGNRNGQVREVEVLDAAAHVLVRAVVPAHAAGHRISLPPDTRSNRLTLRIRSSRAGPYAAVAEIDVEEASPRER